MSFDKPAVTNRQAGFENIVIGKSQQDLMSPRQPLVLSPMQISEFGSPRDNMLATFSERSTKVVGSNIIPRAMSNRKLVEDNS